MWLTSEYASGTVMAVASALAADRFHVVGAFASRGRGVRRLLGSNSTQRVSSEFSNDPWDPPPAYLFEISGVLWIGAEKAFLHEALDDKPKDTQAEKRDTG